MRYYVTKTIIISLFLLCFISIVPMQQGGIAQQQYDPDVLVARALRLINETLDTAGSAEDKVRAIDNIITSNKALFAKNFDYSFAQALAKRQEWSLFAEITTNLIVFANQNPVVSKEIDAIIVQLQGIKNYLLEVNPQLLLTKHYNLNAPEQVLPSNLQLLSIWQMLDYNAFFKLPLSFLEESDPYIYEGLNQKNYVAFIRKNPVSNAQLFQEQPKNVNDEILFTNIGGADASCGYHALRNAIIIVRALYKKDMPEQLVNILSLHAMLQLFGTRDSNKVVLHKNMPGQWRLLIEQKRYKDVLSYILDEQLKKIESSLALSSPPPPSPGRKPGAIDRNHLWNIYRTLLNNYKQKIKQEIFDQAHTISFDKSSFALQRPIKFADVYTFIQQSDIPQGLERDVDVAKLLTTIKNETMVNSFFDSSFSMNLALSLNNNNDWQSYVKALKQRSDEPFDLNGDWLNQEEIELLFNLEQKQGLLAELPDIEISFINLALELDPTLEMNQERLKKIEKTFKNRSNAVHIFILKADGTLNPITGLVSGKHWICCIANKVNNEVQYLIADSENAARYDNEVIKAIIEATR